MPLVFLPLLVWSIWRLMWDDCRSRSRSCLLNLVDAGEGPKYVVELVGWEPDSTESLESLGAGGSGFSDDGERTRNGVM